MSKAPTDAPKARMTRRHPLTLTHAPAAVVSARQCSRNVERARSSFFAKMNKYLNYEFLEIVRCYILSGDSLDGARRTWMKSLVAGG